MCKTLYIVQYHQRNPSVSAESRSLLLAFHMRNCIRHFLVKGETNRAGLNDDHLKSHADKSVLKVIRQEQTTLAFHG